MENYNELDKNLFTPLSDEEKKFTQVQRPSVGYWKDAWRRLKSNKVALISLIVVILCVVSAVFVPLISP